MRYRVSEDGLTVSPDSALGEVELIWYRLAVQAVTVNGADVPIAAEGLGQRIRFDGQLGASN